jgi:hypothetical protein
MSNVTYTAEIVVSTEVLRMKNGPIKKFSLIKIAGQMGLDVEPLKKMGCDEIVAVLQGRRQG